MNLYLYNVSRGQLTNIPAVGTNDMLVTIYSGTNAPSGSGLPLPLGGGIVTDGHTNITASYVETGIYSCSFAFNSSSIEYVYDVWHSGGIEYHTGSSIDINTYNSSEYNFDQRYISNVINLRSNYSRSETARLRLYTRLYDWSPNVYTVASNAVATSIIDNIYYKVVRANDGLVVINYGTGSTNHTRISYDNSGSYFDFDMGMLESNHTYKFQFVYLINGGYVEQPEIFRFKVT
jgi:hypothetical protein